MTAPLTDGGARYCDHCGRSLSQADDRADHATCRRARLMEPPRYCPYCRRRVVVQVIPHGWAARCVRHGTRTSEDNRRGEPPSTA